MMIKLCTTGCVPNQPLCLWNATVKLFIDKLMMKHVERPWTAVYTVTAVYTECCVVQSSPPKNMSPTDLAKYKSSPPSTMTSYVVHQLELPKNSLFWVPTLLGFRRSSFSVCRGLLIPKQKRHNMFKVNRSLCHSWSLLLLLLLML